MQAQNNNIEKPKQVIINYKPAEWIEEEIRVLNKAIDNANTQLKDYLEKQNKTITSAKETHKTHINNLIIARKNFEKVLKALKK